MPIKKEEEEPFSAPPWIVTFSDMIGLLTSFFIMLMTYSTKDRAEFRRLRGSLLGEFGLIADPATQDYDALLAPEEALANNLRNDGLRKEREDLQQLDEGAKILVRTAAGEDVEYERLADGGRLRLITPSTFPDGGSHLTPQAKASLAEIADLMRLHACRYVVVGHCWDEGDGVTALDDLSRDRAIEVASWLTTVGRVPKSSIGIAARGDRDPILRQHGDEAVQKNRRIEIVVLQDS
jgi:chemotaxis protein MotB